MRCAANHSSGRLLDRRDVEAVHPGELEVALVAARHGHDRPGAVAHQHVVGDPDRDVLAGDRVGGVRAGEHAGLLRSSSWRSVVLERRRLLAVLHHLGGLLRGGQLGHQRMLGGEHHERGAEQRVGAGGEHGDRPGRGVEVDARAGRPADPVALHRLQRVRPVEPVEVLEQAVGVRRDAHHPLAHRALEHREVAAVAAPVGGDLLVGDDRAEARAPVDRRVGDVGEALRVDDVGPLGRGQRRPGRAVGRRRVPASYSAISSPIGRARPAPPSGAVASGSYHESKMRAKIHCVQR